MKKTAARSLLTMAHAPLGELVARGARLWPAPAQRFARGALRRVLREFPLLGELLELTRVLVDKAGIAAPAPVASGPEPAGPVTRGARGAAAEPASPAPKPRTPSN